MTEAPAPAPADNLEAPAAAPAAEPAATPPAEPAAPAGEPAAPAAEPGAASSLEGFVDPELKAYAEGKFFDKAGFEGVVKSYKHLEKIMSLEKAGMTVTLIGDDATPEQQNEFFTKLGRPEDAAGYGLAPVEGEDSAFADWAGATFHKAGLTAKQAAAVATAWGEFSSAHTQATTDAATIEATDATAELKKEWGAAYDDKVAGIDRAATALGMDADHLTALRTTMGPVAAMKFVDGLAGKLGDDTFEGGEARTGELTPEMARVKLAELTGSKDFQDAWMDKMHPNHKNVVEQKAALSRQIAGIAA